jgi:hypothetical protein
MAHKKISLDVAVKRTAEILQDYFATLPAADAKAMRRELSALAAKSSRSANSA